MALMDAVLLKAKINVRKSQILEHLELWQVSEKLKSMILFSKIKCKISGQKNLQVG